MKDLLCIGASTRLAYQPFLAEDLKGYYNVSGPAENCGCSNNIKEKISGWLKKYKSQTVLINCGLHDMRYLINDKIYQSDISVYQENLISIFNYLTNEMNKEVFWHTITPINEQLYNNKVMQDGTNRRFYRYQKDWHVYNDASRKIASQFKVHVIDFDENRVTPMLQECLSSDGIHFSDEGSKKIAKEISSHILKTHGKR